MKYIIDVDKDRIDCSGQLFIAVDIPNSQSAYEIPTGIWVKDYIEPDRKVIEDEVWELADYMCRMSQTERSRCFGFSYPSEVTKNLTFQEAKSKFEKWMESESENEIRVGDEVIHNGEIKTVLCIFLGQLTLYDSDGHTFYVKIENENIKKTGKHHNEVAELLEKMRGEEE